MEWYEYFRVVLAFCFVLGLIGICYWLVRRYAVERFGLAMNLGKVARLRVVESKVLDGRRRLVLVRRDDVEHLLVIGGESDIVVESGIPAPPLPASLAASLAASAEPEASDKAGAGR